MLDKLLLNSIFCVTTSLKKKIITDECFITSDEVNGIADYSVYYIKSNFFI